MNTKHILYALILVVVLVSSVAIVYIYYFSQQSATQGPITITDDLGYVTTLDTVPQRIVSMAPANTQFIFALGVGDKVVGVTQYDDYPYDFSAWFEAGNMTNIGGFSTPNIETIVSLEPDLILATTIHEGKITPNLRSMGYKVITTNPNSINDIYKDITMLGKATGAQDKANELINQISSQISDIQSKIAAANIADKPTVYYEVYFDESGIMTAGSTSWINDVIAKAGGINIFADLEGQYPTTSSEVIVQRNPSVILLPTNMGTGTPSYGSVDDVKARPGWNTIDAIVNNRLFVVEQDLFNQPGPRVGDQVQAVAACLYPTLITPPE